jgi:hypothetical protein
MRRGDDLDDDFVAEGFEADVFSDDELGMAVVEELSEASDEWLGTQPAVPAPNKKRKRTREKEKKSKACTLSQIVCPASLTLQIYRNASWQRRLRARTCPRQ